MNRGSDQCWSSGGKGIICKKGPTSENPRLQLVSDSFPGQINFVVGQPGSPRPAAVLQRKSGLTAANQFPDSRLSRQHFCVIPRPATSRITWARVQKAPGGAKRRETAPGPPRNPEKVSRSQRRSATTTDIQPDSQRSRDGRSAERRALPSAPSARHHALAAGALPSVALREAHTASPLFTGAV